MASFRPFLIIAAAALSAVAASGARAATNLVVNPGFEGAASLGPWVSNGWIDASFQTGILPYDGDHFASSGCTSPVRCTLAQSLATTAGQSYDLSFAYNPGVQAQFGADLQVFWNGALVTDIDSATTAANAANAWQVYSFTGLAAASGATTLSFSSVQPLVVDGLDDVSVTSAAATSGSGAPEPATWGVMILGFGLAGTAVRRRSRLAS